VADRVTKGHHQVAINKLRLGAATLSWTCVSAVE
jgi:hypothetical protein